MKEFLDFLLFMIGVIVVTFSVAYIAGAGWTVARNDWGKQ